MKVVADIGGTNARFAWVDEAGAVRDVVMTACAAHAQPEEALRTYLERIGQPPRFEQAALAVAAPISGPTVTLTNSSWRISAPALQTAFGAQRVVLLNDFEALAHALPRLGADDMLQLGGTAINKRLPMAVIGPGTGLGVSACLPRADGGWLALASEGGHVTLAPADDDESEILRFARAEIDHVSAERLLSGRGLPLLHRAVGARRGAAPVPLSSEEIVQRALQEGDALCVQTVDVFCALLGSFAGNVALTFGARGGVFMAGGVAQRLSAYLPQSPFRARFEAKGRFSTYLAPICTALITAPHMALLGAARVIAGAPGGG